MNDCTQNCIWGMHIMEQSKEKIIGKIIYNKLSVEGMRYNMYSSDDI